MKKYLIKYVKYGTVANYNRTEIVEARGPKAALMKFYNHKEFGDTRTTRDWMQYNTEVNGIHYSEPEVIELK